MFLASLFLEFILYEKAIEENVCLHFLELKLNTKQDTTK